MRAMRRTVSDVLLGCNFFDYIHVEIIQPVLAFQFNFPAGSIPESFVF
jgi:hypothetical protein